MTSDPEIRLLAPPDIAAAFDVATEVFVASSTLHSALGIGLGEYRAYLRPSFNAMAAEGLSVLATDPASGTVVGCLIATDFHHQLDTPFPNNLNFQPLTALGAELARQYQTARSVVPGDVLLVDMAAVHPDANGRGVYSSMRAAVHRTAKARGFRYVIGELSSTATQHIVLGRLQHRKMAEVRFAEFMFDGNFPFRSIKDPTSIILAEGSL